ncbi:MAG: hypothetical protein AAF688_03850 [Bacteroidota bacterium]
MKKFYVLFVLFIGLASCSIEDEDRPAYSTDFVGIESVDMPEEFILGQTHEITMTFLRPTSCHLFYDLFYDIEENQRTVAITTISPVEQDCEVLEDDEVEVSFNFEVLDTEPYVFRFYQGEDENGEDVFHIVEVPVSIE